MVPGWPVVVGAALKPSGSSPGVSQREGVTVLEGGFPKVQLHASCKRCRAGWIFSGFLESSSFGRTFQAPITLSERHL
jgi:hypothetical protein